MKNKLFGTFSNLLSYEDLIKNLTNNFSIISNKIYVLGYDIDSVICTYNLDQYNLSYLPLNTVSLHRKKETNTLYTINALNLLITNLCGFLDKDFKINWEDYNNKFFLVQNNELKIYDVKLIKVYK